MKIVLFIAMLVSGQTVMANSFKRLQKAASKAGGTIGDGLQDIGDQASDTFKEAQEAAKNAGKGLGQQGTVLVNGVEVAVTTAARQLAENVAQVADAATEVVTEIEGATRVVIVRAGETLTDARERALRGLEHLPTPRWHFYKDVFKNIEDVKPKLQLSLDLEQATKLRLDQLPDVRSPDWIAEKKAIVTIPDWGIKAIEGFAHAIKEIEKTGEVIRKWGREIDQCLVHADRDSVCWVAGHPANEEKLASLLKRRDQLKDRIENEFSKPFKGLKDASENASEKLNTIEQKGVQ